MNARGWNGPEEYVCLFSISRKVILKYNWISAHDYLYVLVHVLQKRGLIVPLRTDSKFKIFGWKMKCGNGSTQTKSSSLSFWNYAAGKTVRYRRQNRPSFKDALSVTRFYISIYYATRYFTLIHFRSTRLLIAEKIARSWIGSSINQVGEYWKVLKRVSDLLWS